MELPLSTVPPAAIKALRELLSSKRRIAIVTHYNPDGDAMGSSLGLAHVLNALGHQAQVVLPNTPPAFLHWMPGHAQAIAFDRQGPQCEEAIRTSDVLFCLDFNRPDRVNGLEQAVREATCKVLVDHHRDPEDFAAIAFSDTTACATCQMIFDIVLALDQRAAISADAATCLYTGIMTDSGSFRFGSTTPHTLEAAADLMRLGAVPDRIHGAIMDDNSESRMRLLGFALSERMRVLPELATTVIAMGRADLERFGFQPGDTEGLVNYGLAIRGMRLAAFFIERKDGVKISLRSKGTLPVNEFLSAHFQGGGHANAAGGQTQEPLDVAVDHFLRELPAFIAKHPA